MAYGVKSHKFLCCLPVRLGVFVLSFLHFFLYGLLAIGLWWSLGQKDRHYDKREKISIILTGIYLSIHAIYALVGFIGAISRRLSLITFYSGYLVYMFCLAVIFGIYYIIIIFTKDRMSCQHITAIRFVFLGFMIFSWLVSLYECIILDRYVKQLEEEKKEKHRLKTLNASVYNTVGGRESTEGFAVQFRDESGSMNARGEVKLYGPGPREEV